MELKLGATISYFLWSLAAGIMLAFLYDFLRSSRKIFKTSVLGVNIEDILFLIGTGCFIFWLGYDKNNGIVRVQGLLGLLLGFWLYRKLFRDYIVRFIVWVSGVLVRTFLIVVRIILYPLKVIFRILSKPFYVIAWYSSRWMNGMERIMRPWIRRKVINRKIQNSRTKK